MYSAIKPLDHHHFTTKYQNWLQNIVTIKTQRNNLPKKTSLYMFIFKACKEMRIVYKTLQYLR